MLVATGDDESEAIKKNSKKKKKKSKETDGKSSMQVPTLAERAWSTQRRPIYVDKVCTRCFYSALTAPRAPSCRRSVWRTL